MSYKEAQNIGITICPKFVILSAFPLCFLCFFVAKREL